VVESLQPGQRVAGVAVASMGEAGVLVDEAGRSLFPIMTWHDRRTLPWVDWWRDRLSPASLYEITGLPLDSIYSANKLLWLRQQAPQAFDRAHHWLCLADWITFRLTGQASTSYSLASRTMLFDLRTRSWSDELLHLAGLPAALMPTALPSGEIVGYVTPGASQVTGIQSGVPVITGGHDHICAALAAGVIQPGAVLDSAGTTEALVVTLDRPILHGEMAATGLSCGCHTVCDRYYLKGGIMAGGVLAWISSLLTGDDSPILISHLMEEAAASPPGANGVWFVPYLDGSGPPSRDPLAWGAWLGLQLQHSRADLVRAAVEGVSYAIRFLLESLQASAGSAAGELRCVGGSTRNPFWQQVKADVIGMPIDTPAIADITAQGAALLAGIGVGAFGDEAEAARRTYRSAVRYAVDAEHSAYYDVSYRQVFMQLYSIYQSIRLD